MRTTRTGFAVRVGERLWLSTAKSASEERTVVSERQQIFLTREEAFAAVCGWLASPAPLLEDASAEPHIVEVAQTILPATYASGDCECFCFDTRTVAEVERQRAALRRSQHLDMSEDVADWALHDRMVEEVRVYPNDLLPAHGGRRGRWVVTVEFEPDEGAPLLYDAPRLHGGP